MNWDLRRLIVDQYGSQCEAAGELGIGESRLSRILNGRSRPTSDELKLLGRAFGSKAIRTIFPRAAASDEQSGSEKHAE